MNYGKKALYFSVSANTYLGILGILFYFLTESDAVLLDGLFNVISLMGLLSFGVVRLLSIPEDHRYHFGSFMYEPLNYKITDEGETKE
jgi:predicted Co/Zn/Cd cation transporter (cation efflux family)